MRRSRLYPAVLAAIGWGALAWHFSMCVMEQPATAAGLGAAVAKFLSFFTILTNILVAAALTAYALRGKRAWSGRPRIVGAIATYIVIVELVYTGLLRWLWHPNAVQLVVDILLHDVMAVGFVVFWWGWVPRGDLRVRNIWPWLIYPLAFAVYNNVCMAIWGGKNPYVFLDVRTLGYAWVAVSIIVLASIFSAVGWAFVALDHLKPPGKDVSA